MELDVFLMELPELSQNSPCVLPLSSGTCTKAVFLWSIL